MKRQIALWLAPKLSHYMAIRVLEWGTGDKWCFVPDDLPKNEGDLFLPNDDVCRWVRVK